MLLVALVALALELADGQALGEALGSGWVKSASISMQAGGDLTGRAQAAAALRMLGVHHHQWRHRIQGHHSGQQRLPSQKEGSCSTGGSGLLGASPCWAASVPKGVRGLVVDALQRAATSCRAWSTGSSCVYIYCQATKPSNREVVIPTPLSHSPTLP